VLPGAMPSVVADLEKKATHAESLSKRILAGESPLELLKPFVHSSPLIPIEHECPIKYTCKCTNERVERTLLLLGRAALAEMTLKGGPADVQCEFCGKKYTVAHTRLKELHDSTN
jgi:molecular chaperone Hsp33